MSGLLTWRAATQQDRGELQHFTCTEEPTKSHQPPYSVHRRQYEHDVQCWIRGQLGPAAPCRPPRYLELGTDAEGIGAVAWYEETDGPAEVFLRLMAVHCRLRNRCGGYADEMVEHVLDRVTARAVETDTRDVAVTGHVDENNRASQAMCRRAGLRHVGMFDEHYQVWAIRLVLDIGNLTE